MLDIRKRTGWLFFAVMMAQVILVSAQVQSKSGVKVLTLVTFEVFSRIERATSGGVSGVRNVWDSYFALRGVRAENEELRRQLAQLQVKLQEEHALAARSQRLQALMDLQSSSGLPTLAAEVIGGNPNPGLKTVTIGRGSADGVHTDMAVVSPTGVVGRIIGQPATHAARVQLLIDRNAAAGALVERSRAGGMVVGTDADPPLRMELVANLADVKDGDDVVSSGVDGIYPKGFLIGRVERSERGNGLYRKITIRPAVDFSSIEEVLVVLVPPRPATRDEGVQ
ncbi:MAG: rod shape-determining protein MreC [Acidobacteria bacterium]|nr:rod shape-determining protein MreC [Acidobacteriota bacterium]